MRRRLRDRRPSLIEPPACNQMNGPALRQGTGRVRQGQVVREAAELSCSVPYGLVPLTPQVIQALEEFGPRALTGIFESSPATGNQIWHCWHCQRQHP